MRSLSLIIPCYNEAKSLPSLIERCAAVVSARPGTEIILVDNGSMDETPVVLKDLLPGNPGCRSVRVEVNEGYGFGILAGLRAASGDILAWTHADLQTDPADVLKGAALYDESPDPDKLFVKGTRFGRPVSDVVFTVGMAIFETALLMRPLWDVNAQPTMFPRSFFSTWKTPPHDFALDLYAYYNAVGAHFTVKRFPVHFGRRLHGQSHWNINWSSKWKFIRRTVAFSLTLRSGAYK